MMSPGAFALSPQTPSPSVNTTQISLPDIRSLAVEADIHIKFLGRLGRYRIIIHNPCNMYGRAKMKALTHSVFQLSDLASYTEYGLFAQSMLHVTFRSTNDPVIENVQPDQESDICHFESRETVEQIVRSDSFSGRTGTPSIFMSSEHWVHLDVLTILESAPQLPLWYSPVLYCYHSINVVFVDWRSDLLLVQRRLQEILTHSTAYSVRPEDKYRAKVLLIIDHAERMTLDNIKKRIDTFLRPYLSLFIDNPTSRKPFFLCHSDMRDACNVLMASVREKTKIDARAQRYPHMAVVLWQTLRRRDGVVDLGSLRTEMRNLMPLNHDMSAVMVEDLMRTMLLYLHNSGLVYNPGKLAIMPRRKKTSSLDLDYSCDGKMSRK